MRPFAIRPLGRHLDTLEDNEGEEGGLIVEEEEEEEKENKEDYSSFLLTSFALFQYCPEFASRIGIHNNRVLLVCRGRGEELNVKVATPSLAVLVALDVGIKKGSVVGVMQRERETILTWATLTLCSLQIFKHRTLVR